MSSRKDRRSASDSGGFESCPVRTIESLHRGFFVARTGDGDLSVARKSLATMFGQKVDVLRGTVVRVSIVARYHLEAEHLKVLPPLPRAGQSRAWLRSGTLTSIASWRISTSPSGWSGRTHRSADALHA